jgi:hypothetical protein
MTRRHAAALISAVTVACVIGSVVAPSIGAKPRPSPRHWDSRIVKYVTYVERHRGMKFKHPIPVKFLDDKAFNKAVTVSDQDLTKADRKYNKQLAGDLYAVGLIGPGVDLVEANNAVSTSDVTGFYDDETKTMSIRGTKLDNTEVRVTVVHELTHALQDQYFNLPKLDNAVTSSGAELALTALIEGDATWVEESYVATLPKAEQDKYYGDVGTAVDEAPKPGDAPPAVDLLSSAPYDLGYFFVDYVRSKGGTDALNREFEHPPPTDEQVFDPLAFVDQEKAKTPRAPALAEGETKRGSPDELGAYELYLVLATRLAPRTALRAATGWNGDEYRPYATAGQECIRDAIVTDGSRDARELTSAITAWIAKGSTGAASVKQKGAEVVLSTCGVASVVVPTQETLSSAEDVASGRYANFAQIRDIGIGPKPAQCAADLVATDPELTAVLYPMDPDAKLTAAQKKLIRTRLLKYFDTCHAKPPSG